MVQEKVIVEQARTKVDHLRATCSDLCDQRVYQRVIR